MRSKEQLSKRLGVFADSYGENSFVFKSGDMVFARANKCGTKWHVWYYTKHLQKDFDKLKEAMSAINEDFIEWWENRAIHETVAS